MQRVCAIAVVLGVACVDPAGSVHGDEPEERSSAATRSPALVERGRYLAEHVAACPDCHTPRRPDRTYDTERWLAGVDCFYDAVPDDPDIGCLSTRNLTNHPTGLANRSDAEIVAMIRTGVRPDGSALHAFMPYSFFANMRDDDVRAVVAYLRSVPGIDHTITPSQAPFLSPPEPAPPVADEVIPMPRIDYPERAAALRGRYLAGSIGACLDCHTPRGEHGIDFTRPFAGGMRFDSAAMGLPDGYPKAIYAANLTPHPTGIIAYSIEDIVRAVKHGEDKHQGGASLCPPMPAGPDDSFGGLSDRDAEDIAHYLASLEPIANAVPEDCRRTLP